MFRARNVEECSRPGHLRHWHYLRSLPIARVGFSLAYGRFWLLPVTKLSPNERDGHDNDSDQNKQQGRQMLT